MIMLNLAELHEWEKMADSFYRKQPGNEPFPDEHEPFGWELESERMKVSRGDRDYILGDE